MFSKHALATAIIVFSAADAAHAQATNPPYLASFPPVDRVKQAMKAADERETAVRQIGAFWQLEQIIRQLSGSREFRGFLPDEARIIGEYQVASYNIAQAIDKAYPGRYNGSVTVSDYAPYRFMRTDRRFGVEGIETFRTLLTPAVQTQFAQSVGGDIARREARQKADADAMASTGSTGQPQSRLSEEQAGIRRCVESGRSETQCMMEGLGKSAMNMMGGVMPGLRKEPIRGLRMSGQFGSSGGLRLSFYPEQVSVGCDEIVPEFMEYSVSTDGAQVRITIPVQPKPIVLTMQPDGRLLGAGIVSLTGQVQVGTQFGTRTYSDGRTEPISRAVYETQTRRCNTTLGVIGPTTDGTISGGLTGMVTAVFGNADKNEKLPIPVGLRIAGEWGSESSVDLEFRPEGVVVGCREATILRPYIVQAGSGRVSISVQHGSAPFTLAFGGDGRISGAGSLRVDGRMVSGTTGNGEITYVPRSATCTLGPLNPKTSQ